MLLDLLFPNRCLQCNRIIAAQELVCGICIEQVNFTHQEFTTPNSLTERCSLLFPVKHAFALMQFEEDSLSRKIVHQLKYGKREIVGKVLAGWVCERLDFADDAPDLIITVPLHTKKLRERGYNQLHLFTETLAAHFNIAFDLQLVKRNHYRKAQAKKDKLHRTGTEGLFSVTKRIENRHLLIIDDVFTTGNTMSSVAWEILKAGNNTVSVLVMAVDE